MSAASCDTERVTRVLFVCLGNAVRSQMAEGFARAYGWDVIKPASAGLMPALAVDPTAVRVMEEIGISISDAFPKHFRTLADRLSFDLVVNISGRPLPGGSTAPVQEWEVPDPVGRTDDDYRRARDQIQRLTLTLINQLRAAPPAQMAVPTAPAPAADTGPRPETRPQLDHRRRIRAHPPKP